MPYKAVTWTDSPSNVALVERLPCQASAGAGASFYRRDAVLAYSEKPEYESIESFLAYRAEEESQSFDWEDLTGLVCVTKIPAAEVKQRLAAAGLTLRTYRPTGSGETMREYRQRVSLEDTVAEKIATLVLVAHHMAERLPEDVGLQLKAIASLCAEPGYRAMVETMTRDERIAALVNLASAHANAGDPSAAMTAVIEAGKLLTADSASQTEAAKAQAKAIAAARAAAKLSKKAEILRVYEQATAKKAAAEQTEQK